MVVSQRAVRHGDCFDVMGEMADGGVDLLLCDPPYGTTQNQWDSPLPLDRMWLEFRRVTKPNGAILLFAAQPFATDLIASNRADFRYDLVWRKNKATGFLNANKQPLRAHELILVFYQKSPTFFPQKTAGHRPGNAATQTSHGSGYGEVTHVTEYGGSTERYPTSVIDMPVVNNDNPQKIHPTQKPVELMQWLVKSYSEPGDLVFDPTCGSGTTGVAALRCGRRFVGCEMDAEYAAAANVRIKEVLV